MGGRDVRQGDTPGTFPPGKIPGRGQLKCDGTCAETRFSLSAKRTSPFKLTRESVQSTTGSRGVRISGSNAGYTMFRGSVKSTGYSLHSPVSPSLPLPCVTVCHHISNAVYPFYRRLCGLRSRSGLAHKISRRTGLEPRTNQLIARHYTDYALPVSYRILITMKYFREALEKTIKLLSLGGHYEKMCKVFR